MDICVFISDLTTFDMKSEYIQSNHTECDYCFIWISIYSLPVYFPFISSVLFYTFPTFFLFVELVKYFYYYTYLLLVIQSFIILLLITLETATWIPDPGINAKLVNLSLQYDAEAWENFHSVYLTPAFCVVVMFYFFTYLKTYQTL